MAADANRLAAALAYEDDRKRRLAETIPTLTGPTTAPRRSVRTDLENLSAGLGQGITTQLEGIKGLITDPVGTAKGAYEAARAVVRDPSVLAAALSQMGQKAMSGPLGAGEVIGEMLGPMRGKPVMAEIDVYHGTPHRFPGTEANPLGEFDASKINTGEGAQAFGHGIYLAESPKVAEGYKERLAASSYMKDSQSVAYGKIWQKAADAALETGAAHPDYSRAISSQIMDWVDGGRKPETFLRYNRVPPSAKPAYEAAVKEYVGLQKTPGNLYTADLPDEMIDRMLDWDKPLSEQPAVFKQLMKVTDLTGTAGFLAKSPETTTFGELYNALKNQNPQSDVSEYFRKGGIPGIKYLDAGSRGQGGSGTRNFVVFPGEEKKVRILERK